MILPYELSDLPPSLRLQKKFSLDTEDNAMAEKGITDIYLFDTGYNILLKEKPLKIEYMLLTVKGDMRF